MKASLNYRQKVALGIYLSEHFLTDEQGRAVQITTISMEQMLKELNLTIKPGECSYNENHVHHARLEIYGKLAPASRAAPTNGSAAQAEQIASLTLRLETLEARLDDLWKKLTRIIPGQH